MTHRFPVKEIALQSGTSVATVDRVLHGRQNVSPQTRRRVMDALNELEGQEQQLSARGRRLFFDFLVEAPKRFSSEIRQAVEREIQTTRTAVIRPRFLFQEQMSDEQCLAHLERIIQRGSHGVCLKVRDRPAIHEAIAELAAKKIPILTLFTDIPQSKRLAYLGMDNEKAGKIAAYLISQSLPKEASKGSVLLTRSHEEFVGEEERARGFTAAIKSLRPELDLLDMSGAAGLHQSTIEQLRAMLPDQPDIVAVYSIGGGNRAIIECLDQFDIHPVCFVAHDLDKSNHSLLTREKIQYVLHDRLQDDMAAAFHHLLRAHNLCPEISPSPTGSEIHIIVPAHVSDGLG
ncbi:LacI family DNA-binding transcriptional regulator [Cohaesibacter gelatinilyticus]|jgi:LacI family transcriptional regulator|uniref:LacI family transcriptional regulator n=1 Tax=Cohaesibacter gelatinilyticus TaxID=372072 RepID=A0A285PJK5_9HYPH|nr:LacI family DNA-binding transcriptional regulator [Cohaesibacter gelatinilyticus]SNZ21463.1 LacI family transcriptional regulator [Cohaesibacter gelatinilyticus]